MQRNNTTSQIISDNINVLINDKAGTSRSQHHPGLSWIDLENPSRKDLASYASQYNLHPLQVEECFSKGQLPQIEVEKEYIFLLLYIPRQIYAENRIVADHIGIFLGKDFLVTVHEEATLAIPALFEAYKDSSGPNGNDLKKSPADVVLSIISNLLIEISAMINSISQELEEMESQVFDIQSSDAYRIGQLRQKIMRLRRIISSQKEISIGLSTSIKNFGTESLARHYINNRKITDKLWEAIEEAEETVEIYKDADFTTSTEKTNEILTILTLIFTLTIPATVLGTFFGMNVLVPGGIEVGPWTFLGPFTTLILIIISSLIPIVVMLWYFKKKKWF